MQSNGVPCWINTIAAKSTKHAGVRCLHKDKGCDWDWEVNGLKRHDDLCAKRLCECEYCGLKYEYGMKERKHRLTCLKFPEPCPNMCGIGSVERGNMEQHLSVCPLEPVACEMKEFGCSVVVPRKDLARHMRESELQHLTAMTVMNLRLTRQLQQDSTERDRKIAQLQQEMTHQKTLQNETSRKIEQLQLEIKTKMDEQKRVMDKSLQLTEAQFITQQHVTSCSGSEVFTFPQYFLRRGSETEADSGPFYSHRRGYKFKLRICYYEKDIGAELLLLTGLFDDELRWPMLVRVRLEILNQAEDRHNVVKGNTIEWRKYEREWNKVIDDCMIKYSTLERQGGGIQYMMNDFLKFKIITTIL